MVRVGWKMSLQWEQGTRWRIEVLERESVDADAMIKAGVSFLKSATL